MAKDKKKKKREDEDTEDDDEETDDDDEKESDGDDEEDDSDDEDGDVTAKKKKKTSDDEEDDADDEDDDDEPAKKKKSKKAKSDEDDEDGESDDDEEDSDDSGVGEVIRVDFTDVEERENKPIPEAIYDAKVVKALQKMSKKKPGKKSSPFIEFEFKISSGKHKGAHQWFRASLLKVSLWNLRRVLISLGVSPKKLQGKFKVDLAGLIGRPCRISVAREYYQGDLTNKVRAVMAPQTKSDDEDEDDE